MTERDEAGKFVKAVTEEVGVPDEVEAPKLESLRLQSKFRNHTVMIRPITRKFYPELGVTETIPGLFAKFEGPQRIFDSEYAQEAYGWSDAERQAVERKLVKHNGFMSDYFLAALTRLPEHLVQFAHTKPVQARRICQAFGWIDGVLTQCEVDALPGIDYCVTHDPNTTKIVQGRLGTTKD